MGWGEIVIAALGSLGAIAGWLVVAVALYCLAIVLFRRAALRQLADEACCDEAHGDIPHLPTFNHSGEIIP